MSANNHAETRRLERHGSATLRALSSEITAEYRARRLKVDGLSVPFAAPYLSQDFAEIGLSQSRGIADALAVRIRYSDRVLHNSLAPDAPFQRIVFDILEQIRAESQVPAYLTGVRENLDQAFLSWCLAARSNALVESQMGILVYTLIHMVRARLINNRDDEEVEGLIEATRAALAPLIGEPFYKLFRARDTQSEFAVHALEIARLIDELVDEAVEDTDQTRQVLQRNSLILGPDWDNPDLDSAGVGGGGIAGGDADVVISDNMLESAGDYHVYTREFDATVDAAALYSASQRQQLRIQLDQLARAQAVSITRLALRLKQLFATPNDDGLMFGQDAGRLDGRRLSQLVSNPAFINVFQHQRPQLESDAVVTFLIDNSGSMKALRLEAVAVLVDTFARALDLAGIKSEILGFSTRDWNGGRAQKAWRAARQPEAPGRLTETLHVIYKDADTTWRRSRTSISAMLKTLHFREGIDGEALVWAYRRLMQREETRRILVVISDGAPMDASTHNTNRPGFLTDHLRHVANFISNSREVELCAIGIDLDLSEVYANSLLLDLEGTLTNQSYRSLETLFSRY